MRVWRICKKIYSARAFSGEGGLIAPARWHHKGYRIVYAAQSLSLAALETWVHISPPKPLPDHVAISADIPDDLTIKKIHESTLPPNWECFDETSLITRDIGTDWLKSQVTAVARVPAVTTPGEFNYLLNPIHPDFRRIRAGEAQPFQFDPRMWK